MVNILDESYMFSLNKGLVHLNDYAFFSLQASWYKNTYPVYPQVQMG